MTDMPKMSMESLIDENNKLKVELEARKGELELLRITNEAHRKMVAQYFGEFCVTFDFKDKQTYNLCTEQMKGYIVK